MRVKTRAKRIRAGAAIRDFGGAAPPAPL